MTTRKDSGWVIWVLIGLIVGGIAAAFASIAEENEPPAPPAPTPIPAPAPAPPPPAPAPAPVVVPPTPAAE